MRVGARDHPPRALHFCAPDASPSPPSTGPAPHWLPADSGSAKRRGQDGTGAELRMVRGRYAPLGPDIDRTGGTEGQREEKPRGWTVHPTARAVGMPQPLQPCPADGVENEPELTPKNVPSWHDEDHLLGDRLGEPLKVSENTHCFPFNGPQRRAQRPPSLPHPPGGCRLCPVHPLGRGF